MTIILAAFAALSTYAIIATIVTTVRDGYSRIPARKLS